MKRAASSVLNRLASSTASFNVTLGGMSSLSLSSASRDQVWRGQRLTAALVSILLTRAESFGPVCPGGYARRSTILCKTEGPVRATRSTSRRANHIGPDESPAGKGLVSPFPVHRVDHANVLSFPNETRPPTDSPFTSNRVKVKCSGRQLYAKLFADKEADLFF